ncbi:MAG: transcriptional repressor [Candidatus Omnitrophica bacterium]|nr:transcriptional repressor [Candidatus Omnitrophota bacterium]
MVKPLDAPESFRTLLARRDLKFTYERRRILDLVQHLGRHFDADSLYARFKRRKERIARATIYRTLPLLLEAGVIQKSAGMGKGDFFEKTSARGHHDHMICVHCGKIIEFFNEHIEREQKRLCRKYKFRLTFHDHRLFGYCKKCQA